MIGEVFGAQKAILAFIRLNPFDGFVKSDGGSLETEVTI